MLETIINNIAGFAQSLGYWGIFFMMVLESSFFPFPSEVAMIPAGMAIAKGEMNFSLVLFVGTAGALVGATINYIIGYYLGGKKVENLVNKYGKYFLIKPKHYQKAEKYFEKHGSITTFLARFISVIRQLISIPAGVFKMDFTKFFLYTFLGAGIWNIILILIGYSAGIAGTSGNNIIFEYKYELIIAGIIFTFLVGYIYYLINKKKLK